MTQGLNTISESFLKLETATLRALTWRVLLKKDFFQKGKDSNFEQPEQSFANGGSK